MFNIKTVLSIAVVLVFVLVFSIYKPNRFSFSIFSSNENQNIDNRIASVSNPDIKKRINTPEYVRAIYMSQCVVGTPSFRDKLVQLIKDTELNSVVIDIKDFTGKISFPTENPKLQDMVSDECGAKDMEDFIESLHNEDIYVIGRITVFQDPYYTSKHKDQAVMSKEREGEPWKDFKGLSFIDVSSREYWDLVVELSKESYKIGFDEINYDYIRYPSDGHMDDAVYKNPDKAQALEEFFMFLHQNVKPIGAVMSADLFGMTMVNYDHLGIGQILERALPYFDYISPMVYPSHYPSYYLGLGNPNKDPYRVVNHSMTMGVSRVISTTTNVYFIGAEEDNSIASSSNTSYVNYKRYIKPSFDKDKLRPWLQDFDYGGNYGPEEVRAQIQAVYDAGLDSWILWSASNIYTKEALNLQE